MGSGSSKMAGSKREMRNANYLYLTIHSWFSVHHPVMMHVGGLENAMVLKAKPTTIFERSHPSFPGANQTFGALPMTMNFSGLVDDMNVHHCIL